MPERAAEKDVIRARTAIGQLLGDKIRLLPTADGYLEAEVIGNYGGLVALTSERPWHEAPGRWSKRVWLRGQDSLRSAVSKPSVNQP